jgi:molybdate transport system substrate-binding protein
MNALFLLLLWTLPAAAQDIYAAASLGSALREIQSIYDGPIRLSLAGSSTLARQIEAGAPADLYFSADLQWMDYLQKKGLIADSTRIDLLGNSLAFIAPKGEALAVDLLSAGPPHFSGRLALGDPAHVPAGRYARQALENLGWWNSLSQRLAPAPDVRAALAYVERGQCSLGLVYATDARISERVKTIAILPDSLHQPIVYPLAALVDHTSPAVLRLLSFLRSSQAATVFAQHGFVPLLHATAHTPQPHETPRAR